MGTAASAADFREYCALQRPLALSPGEAVLCQRTNGAWAHARVHRYAQLSSSTAGEGRGGGTVTLHVGAHARKVLDLSKPRHLARIMVRKSHDDESDGGSDGDASNDASNDASDYAGSGGVESFSGPAGASKDGPVIVPARAAARPAGGYARVAQCEPSVFTFDRTASNDSGHALSGGGGSAGGGGKADGGSSSRFTASLRQMENQEESIAAATLRHW